MSAIAPQTTTFPAAIGARVGTTTWLLGGLAAAALLLLLVPGLVGPYGLFIDELYYVACSKRLALGYVDHPPLSLALLALSRAIFRDPALALRIPAAMAGALTVFLTGLLARRLGAARWGQLIAAGAVATIPAFHVLFGFYSMNAFEILFWLAGAWVLVEMTLRDEPRLWLAFGALAGIGLQNKHTFVLFGAAVALGLLLSRDRRHLATRWPWIGLGIAALILLPNLLWQASYGWPSLEFYRNADLYKNVATPPHEVLLMQVLFMSPGTTPLWLGGLAYFLFDREGRRFRTLGWAFLLLLIAITVGQKSRPDRIVGIYPIAIAGGAVLFERLALAARGRWLRFGVPAWCLAWGVLLAPIGLPLLPPAQLSAFVARLGIVPQIEAGSGKVAELPQWMADRFGWEQLADDVAAAFARLTPDERETAVIFAPSYGQAGAIELYGARYGLPPVYSTHNTYYLWGPPLRPFDAAIVVGNRRERLEQWFEEVEEASVYDCDWCMRWRDEMPIWIVRHPRPDVSIAELWPGWKHFE